jgi:membrane associated rhomboid family serine protease
MVREFVSIQLVVVATLAVTVGYAWYLEGRGRWYDVLSRRFVYGVPWGTLVTVVGVVAVYLFAQSGLQHWEDPVTAAFRNWAYEYPLGMITSGFAHGSPSHLLGNMIGTVVLAPIAEYAWGHYPTSRFDDHDGDEGRDAPETDVSAGLLATPWVRALVVFPGVVVAVSLLTSLYALGWSLGFSGTVFVFLGFVLVIYPMTTVVAMVGLSALGAIVATLREPVLQATADPGPPGPPAWAGINVQAHLLGFLVGVLLGLAVLWYRDEWPDVERIFVATLLVVLARQLWSLVLVNDDVYTQYRGIGVVFVLGLTFVITTLVAAEKKPLPSPVPAIARVLSYGWLALVVVGALAAVTLQGVSVGVVLPTLALSPLLALPALVLVGSSRLSPELTHRHAMLAVFVLLAAVIALPSVGGNAVGMDDDPVPGDGAVVVGDYHVTYEENVSHGRVDGEESGLIVVSERRFVWQVAVTDRRLAHDGNGTVSIGGVGWHETVRANRTGWEVTGNDTVYAVDLETDDQEIRSFTSEPARADVRIDDRTITLVPASDQFLVTVTRNGTHVGSVGLPAVNETVAVGDLTFTVERHDDSVALFVSRGETRVLLAEKETF